MPLSFLDDDQTLRDMLTSRRVLKGIAGRKNQEMSHEVMAATPGHPSYANRVIDEMKTEYLANAGIPIVSDAAGMALDAKMFMDKPESRTPLNIGMSALGLLPFVPGMTAWHGSPHKYDKVDLSNVGTGEGAQAYGHGFYSAESQAVAQEYKDALGSKGLSAVDTPYLVDGEKVFPADVDYQQNYQAMMPGMDNFRDDRLKFLTEQAELSSNQSKQYKKMAIDSTNAEDIAHFNNMSDIFDSGYKKNNDLANDLQGMVNRGATVEPAGGHLYKLDIDDSVVDRMLDWDAPLSEQGRSIQDAIAKGGLYDYDLDKLGRGGEFSERIAAGEKLKEVADWMPPRKPWQDLTGNDLIEGITEKYRIAGATNPQEMASKELASLGIPGIKYWDGSSRLGGKGTRNFVNFNADDVKVLERNSKRVR